jgi:hypothetical protein
VAVVNQISELSWAAIAGRDPHGLVPWVNQITRQRIFFTDPHEADGVECSDPIPVSTPISVSIRTSRMGNLFFGRPLIADKAYSPNRVVPSMAWRNRGSVEASSTRN